MFAHHNSLCPQHKFWWALLSTLLNMRLVNISSFKVCCLIPYYFTIFQPGQTSPGQSSDSQNVSQQQSSQQQPQPPTLTEATPQTQPIQPSISLEETQGE